MLFLFLSLSLQLLDALSLSLSLSLPKHTKTKPNQTPKMNNNNNSTVFDTTMETPLLLLSSSLSSSSASPSSTSSRSLTTTTTTSGGSDTDETLTAASKPPTKRPPTITPPPLSQHIVNNNNNNNDHGDSLPYKSLAVLSGHAGTVSCLALCGEFLLSASNADDMIVWQQPDLKPYAKFGHGDGSVKALIASGDRVFTAHQDRRIRVWKLSARSRSPENVFRLVETLPTTKDYLGKFMSQRNYVQTRRHHKRLWIEHSDSISCLAICEGLVYSGSWDKTIKVWRVSDLKCLESIRAHDDAVNGLVSSRGGVVYSASADGKIKAWKREEGKKVITHSNSTNGSSSSSSSCHCLKGILEGHKDVSVNAVAVSDDGKWVYGGGSDGYVMVWERGLESWGLVNEVKAHRMAVLSLCLVGEYLCSGSADKSIRVWKRMALGEICRVGVVLGHQGPVKCLQALPSNGIGFGGGFLLYSGGLDKTLRVWWVPTKKYHTSSIKQREEVH